MTIKDLFNKNFIEALEEIELEHEELQHILDDIPIGETDYYLMEIYNEWDEESEEDDVIKRYSEVRNG